MRTDPWMLETVVYVGAKPPNGQFMPYGTGFLTTRSYKGYRANLIITAKHVVDDCAGDQISYRLNDKNGGVKVITLPKADFCLYHPDSHSDVAAIFAPHDADIYQGKYWTIDRQIRREWLHQYGDVQIGDDIGIIGLYTSHYGLEKNVPIVRSGNIAALPGEPINCEGNLVKGYLAEIRSLGGLSGSPVYYCIPPAFRRDGTILFAKIADYHPIGILLGSHFVESEEDVIEAPKFQHGNLANLSTARQERNTGLSVVAPIEQIFEIAEGEGFIKMAEETLQQIAKESELR